MPGEESLSCPFQIQFCGWMQDIWPWRQDSIHTPFWRLYWNLKPGGVLTSASGTLLLEPDTFVLIPASYEFSTSTTVPFDQFFIHFNFVDTVKAVGDRIYTIPGDSFAKAYIEEFIQSYSDLSNRLRCEMIGHIILGHALLKCKNGPAIRKLPSERRILKCIDFITTRLDEKLDNSRLAEHCGLARNAFIRLFSETMEESPQAFVRRKRIERACHLLHFSNLSIKEIAMRTGFANQYHFSKVFSRLQLNSPRKFRAPHFASPLE